MALHPAFNRGPSGGKLPDLGDEKITRASFLYFNHNPKSPAHEFAQCDTCRMFVPEEYVPKLKKDLCILHGSTVKVGDEYSCGLYASWPEGAPNPAVIKDHAHELIQIIPGSVTPLQSGLVERQVRCQNCEFYSTASRKCELYVTLNKSLPSLFDLDPNVESHGCCNAQTPIVRV